MKVSFELLKIIYAPQKVFPSKNRWQKAQQFSPQ